MGHLSKIKAFLDSHFRRLEQAQLGRDKELLSRDNLSESGPGSESRRSGSREGRRQSSLKPKQQLDSLDVELQAKTLNDKQLHAHSTTALRGQPSPSLPGRGPTHNSELLDRRSGQAKKEMRLFKLEPHNLTGEPDLLGESLAVSKTILHPEEMPSRQYNEALISPKRLGKQGRAAKNAQGEVPHYMIPKTRFPPFNQKLQTDHLMTKEEKANVKHQQMLMDHEKKVYQISRMKPADKVQVAVRSPVRHHPLEEQRRGQDHPEHAPRWQPGPQLHRQLRPDLPLINYNSRMEEGKYDGVLISMLQEGKSYEALFDHLFGFLRRKTDFFSDWSEIGTKARKS